RPHRHLHSFPTRRSSDLVRKISLSEPNSTTTFASIDSARFAVAIWPLMSNRLVVDHVAVSGLKGWIVRDEKGNFNFEDLLTQDPDRKSTRLNSSHVKISY